MIICLFINKVPDLAKRMFVKAARFSVVGFVCRTDPNLLQNQTYAWADLNCRPTEHDAFSGYRPIIFVVSFYQLNYMHILELRVGIEPT